MRGHDSADEVNYASREHDDEQLLPPSNGILRGLLEQSEWDSVGQAVTGRRQSSWLDSAPGEASGNLVLQN
jgi:hypothetical protein